MKNANLEALSSHGVSVWLDDLSRDRLATGDLARLVEEMSVVGVTTNPTIFHSAITGSDLYADQMTALADTGAGVLEVVRGMFVDDVRAACDLLAPVAADSDGVDGRVSLEVDPRLAFQGEATLERARLLWDLVDRSNLLVKIPATRESRCSRRRSRPGWLSSRVRRWAGSATPRRGPSSGCRRSAPRHP